MYYLQKNNNKKNPTSGVPVKIPDPTSVVPKKIPDPTSIAIFNSGPNSDASLIWYSNWSDKEIKDNTDFFELLNETTFFPSIKNCILIAITLSSTTCSVERSFRYV